MRSLDPRGEGEGARSRRLHLNDMVRDVRAPTACYVLDGPGHARISKKASIAMVIITAAGGHVRGGADVGGDHLCPLGARIHGHAPGSDVQQVLTSTARFGVDVHPRRTSTRRTRPRDDE